MIQRIQTVYLVLGAAALAALFFFESAGRGAATAAHAWFTPTVLALGGLAAAAALVAVFLYTNRKKQRRVIVLAQVLTVLHMLALYGGLYLADTLTVRTAQGLDLGALATLLLPLLAYLLFLLARRGVDRDIALVKSMDRLR